MYAEPSSSYGDITRYFVKNSIDVYGKALQRAFISKLLRNPVYVQADMDIYEYFKAQGVKIESPPEMFTGDNSCYLYQGREGEEQILVIAPHQGRIPSSLWLTVQRKLSQNTSFQNGRKCHNTWLAGKIKCGRCGYALVGLRAQNGVTYLRCKQRADNGSCEGAGTLTAQSMESFVYGEMGILIDHSGKGHTLDLTAVGFIQSCHSMRPCILCLTCLDCNLPHLPVVQKSVIRWPSKCLQHAAKDSDSSFIRIECHSQHPGIPFLFSFLQSSLPAIFSPPKKGVLPPLIL